MTTHRFRAYDGTILVARVSGEGPTVVQLSGGPGCVNYLPEPPAGFPATVVSPDPRGVGASEGGPHGIGQALADLEALRESLHLPGWGVVGHSSGADLGLAYAAEHRGSVERLVSVCGTGVQNDRTWHAAYYEAEDSEPDLGLAYDADVHRSLLDDWRRWIREPDLYRKLGRIRREPVFAVAELDIRLPWPVAQLAATWGRELRVVPGAGHDFWHTDPERWWELVALATPRPEPEDAPEDAPEDEAATARDRLRLLDPLVRATEDPQALLARVLAADDVEDARQRLAEALRTDELGATAALDLQVRTFTRRGRARLRQERDDLRARLPDEPGR